MLEFLTYCHAKHGDGSNPFATENLWSLYPRTRAVVNAAVASGTLNAEGRRLAEQFLGATLWKAWLAQQAKPA